jgi:SAM-dependent methyltransferase
MADTRKYAPAAQRNRAPILDALRGRLPETGTVLEIASGTGEHVVHFARALPRLTFRPSDPDPENRASIAAWIAAENLANVKAPIDLDACAPKWPVATADAILCANMIHIAPWRAAEGLIAGAARTLFPGGILHLYGPFMREGRHTAPSNADFDAALKARDPEWGVRDIDAVAALARRAGFGAPDIVVQPANNLSVFFRLG